MKTLLTYLKTRKETIHKEEGFTLPELLISMGVFGILTAIAVPIYLNQQHAVDESALKSSLINASVVVGQEKDANNGLYPTYTPTDMADDNVMKTYIYTYSDDRKEYCVEGTKNGITLFIGTASDEKVTDIDCTLPNRGGVKSADPADNVTPPTTANPAIIAISPASQVGLNGGATITLTGTDFMTGAKVLLGDKTITTVVSSSTSLTFVVPAGFTTYQKENVQVINTSQRTSNLVEYEFIDPITEWKPLKPTFNGAYSQTFPGNITSGDVQYKIYGSMPEV